MVHRGSNTTETETVVDPRLRAMLADSLQMMEELSELTRRLAHLSKTAAEPSPDGVTGEPTGPSDEQIDSLAVEFQHLQQRLASLASEGRRAATQVDANIRQNPYLYLLGALGLGFLLGKAKRL
jgi:hypothetical protein